MENFSSLRHDLISRGEQSGPLKISDPGLVIDLIVCSEKRVKTLTAISVSYTGRRVIGDVITSIFRLMT